MPAAQDSGAGVRPRLGGHTWVPFRLTEAQGSRSNVGPAAPGLPPLATFLCLCRRLAARVLLTGLVSELFMNCSKSSTLRWSTTLRSESWSASRLLFLPLGSAVNGAFPSFPRNFYLWVQLRLRQMKT